MSSSPSFGIAVFHALGDVLNLTPVAAQLRVDHPNAHITWFTSDVCAQVLEGNPHVDEVVPMEGAWDDLDARMPELAASRPWTRFIAPAPYLNYDKAPGGSLWDLYHVAPGLDWTIPVVPVLRLSEAERQRAQAWWSALPGGPRILMECEGRSQQSPWSLVSVDLVADALRHLDPLFVVSARMEPQEAARLRALGMRVVFCDLPWRLNAELYNACDAFLGISSGISALTGSTACRDDIPSVEYVRGEHWSTAGLGRHRRRRHCFSEARFKEALEALALDLSGASTEPTFADRIRVLDRPVQGRERIACPGCGVAEAKPVRGGDVVQCIACELVYLRERPDRLALEAYYRKIYAVGEPTAAPSVRLPESLEVLEEDPAFRAARRAPLLMAAMERAAKPLRQVVDVGCGWGGLLLEARDRGLDTIGFELTESNVAFGRSILGLDLRLQPFPESDIPEGSSDVVTFVHSLEHVPDPLTYLEKAAYVLRDGGVLAVVVPNIASLCSTAMGESWPWLERDWHYYHFTPATLRALAIQAGFEVLACTTRAGDLGEGVPLGILQQLSPGMPEERLRAQLSRLEALGHGEEITLLARRMGTFKGRLRPAKTERKILWIRTDSIGDAILSMPMLPRIAQGIPGSCITVVCQAFTAPLYEACPWVADVISYDRSRAISDESYRGGVCRRIAEIGAHLCLHSVHSREALGDLWAQASRAPERIAFGGDLCNMSEEEHLHLDGVYTRLLPGLGTESLELDRHQAFLEGLGIDGKGLAPMLWLTEADREGARKAMECHGLDPTRTLVLFPGAQYAPRRYPHFGEALQGLVAAEGLRVVALGTASERDLCAEQLKGLPGESVNLAGELPLRVSLALLERSRLAVGAESGLAQACVALGIPHAVVIGGGHFGRFLPYSPLTSLAANPVTCYLCNWQCPHPRPYCITDLPPEVLAAAVSSAFSGSGARPKLFVASEDRRNEGPAFLELAPALDASLVELISIPTRRRIEAPPADPRLTVFCGVWHKDPDRHELLRVHEACLKAQSIPVRRLYVFDGGDLPPAWLESDFVVSSRPLALYEAWDLAVQQVRTPYLMNLNLDDRLSTDAAERVLATLDAGADLVGGDWQICFSRETTDATGPCRPAEAIPFHPDWPPVLDRNVRLGSGTGERGTYGPATAWRASVHQKLPHYPWRFKDGSPVRIIGDAIWWEIVGRAGFRLARLPWIIGHYHSHPDSQAEFRNPAEAEHTKLVQVGVQLL